jgi:hypothetical protein
MQKSELLDRITEAYLASGDFNGLAVGGLAIPHAELEQLLADLVDEDLISLEFGDIHPNPHIKALDPPPRAAQLEKIAALGIANACAYPTPAHLGRVVDTKKYADRPFTVRLYLGGPQLRPCFFDLTVLEFYRNDPRYHYYVSDVGGQISVTSEHSLGGAMPEPDQVVLQTFGFAYDADLNRAVAVYLRYLHDLSPEHQRVWHAKELRGEYKLHPDYWRSTHGHWPEGVSVFGAFLEEMHQVNELARLMGRRPLFRSEFHGVARPRAFGFLIRPTLKEFNAFVLLLDQIVSDNLDLGFFAGDVSLEEERPRADGRVEVVRKGSLRVLDEWLTSVVRLDDPSAKDEVLAAFRKIRALRQRPAHAVEEDVFDQKYFKDQRDLVIEAYRAMRTLRMIFALHPATHEHAVPQWLEGTIWMH